MARARTPSLAARLTALADAADGARGRVDDAVVDSVEQVTRRAEGRLALTGAHTVVALAGATGSGKSSLFNALSGTELATVGVRRPTTSHALAATWGDEPAEDLLDWLAIPRRHGVEAAPVAGSGGRGARGAGLDGLVLLDLPDHDSTEAAHRVEVDRLVELVDLLVWVVDPQKYADAALHDRYLKPLVGHVGSMIIVLNQIDRVDGAGRKQMINDLGRLLAGEGLGALDVVAVSTATGEGVDGLRTRLAKLVTDKQAASRRLAADVTAAAGRLADASGTDRPRGVSRATVERMNQTLAQAAGTDVVVDAVRGSWRRRGEFATGWPVLSWLAKLRRDPLRGLHLGRLMMGSRRKPEIEPARVPRTSLPPTTGVQRARVDSAVRALSEDAAHGLARGWADAVKTAARSDAGSLPDALDRAIATTDLDLDRHRGWWNAVRVLQWLLIGAVLLGLGWLGLDLVLAYLRLPPLPPPVQWHGFGLPTILVVGGVLSGLVLGALSRVGVEVGARRRATAARSRIVASVDQVTRRAIVGPVTAELDRYERVRSALETARG